MKKIVFSTLFVTLAIGVAIRLGFWQLERLEQRRAFNADVTSRLQAPPLMVTGQDSSEPLGSLKYRRVVVRGVFAHAQQIALNNQEWRGQPGVHLVTPLVIEGSGRAVLIDRGWIPYSESSPEKWKKFDEPETVEVKGWIRYGDEGAPSAQVPAQPLVWFRVNIPQIQARASHPLALFYIQQAPQPNRTALPFRSELNLDLGEGPHLGYAITWFAFAAMLGVGYVVFLRNGNFSPLDERQAMSATGSAE